MTLETSKGTMAQKPQQGHVELTGAKVQVTDTEYPGQTWSLSQLSLVLAQENHLNFPLSLKPSFSPYKRTITFSNC